MNADSLFALPSEARRLCGHADYVVIGSLSGLGMADVAAIPGDVTMSIDASCYTLPADWEARLIQVARDGVVAHFLEPHDAAVSKLARGEKRDVRWVAAGARARILSLATIGHRMKSTHFFDAQEQQLAATLLEKIKQGR